MRSLFSVRRVPGWLAVLPQHDHIALAHIVRAAGARPELLLLEDFAVEPGEAGALQRLRHVRNLKTFSCTTLMAVGEYTITQVDAPSVPLAERRDAPWTVVTVQTPTPQNEAQQLELDRAFALARRLGAAQCRGLV